ncbi:MAG: hypothetical protein IJM79_05720 [Erysipelotrichaceae bacterium]|nr:hypothetical protein [Erysipelotrichaceae bacterium]
MDQQKLIEEFRKAGPDPAYDYPKAGVYFKRAFQFYRPFQQGICSELNFFDYTVSIFDQCDKPAGEPDFISPSGSCYWYSDEGVVRKANHWGNGLDNCDWAYRYRDGKMVYGHSYSYFRWFRKPMYGFSPWERFLHKPRIFTINGQEVITTFDNFIARDMVVLDGKTYRLCRQIIEHWKEVVSETDKA